MSGPTFRTIVLGHFPVLPPFLPFLAIFPFFTREIVSLFAYSKILTLEEVP